jgi:hypothetical protein
MLGIPHSGNFGILVDGRVDKERASLTYLVVVRVEAESDDHLHQVESGWAGMPQVGRTHA